MSIRRRLALMMCPELGRPARPTREELGRETTGFYDLEAARRIAREFKASPKRRRRSRLPLRQFPRVMVPFEVVRRCIDALRFPTLLVGPELEKWLSQHVERLGGISCPSRLQRWQLGAARWLTEAPEPEPEATEYELERGPVSLGVDLARLAPRPEISGPDATRLAEAEARLLQRFATPRQTARKSHGVPRDHKSQGVR